MFFRSQITYCLLESNQTAPSWIYGDTAECLWRCCSSSALAYLCLHVGIWFQWKAWKTTLLWKTKFWSKPWGMDYLKNHKVAFYSISCSNNGSQSCSVVDFCLSSPLTAIWSHYLSPESRNSVHLHSDGMALGTGGSRQPLFWVVLISQTCPAHPALSENDTNISPRYFPLMPLKMTTTVMERPIRAAELWERTLLLVQLSIWKESYILQQ